VRVYSSHSLEHALDPDAVVTEFVRVVKDGGHSAIEVPLGFGRTAVDLVDYVSVDDLLRRFGSHV